MYCKGLQRRYGSVTLSSLLHLHFDFYAIFDLGFHSGGSLHFFLRGGRISSAKSTERTGLRSSWAPGKDWPISNPDARSLLDNYKSQPPHLSPVGHFDQRVTDTFFAVMLCLLFHGLKDILPQIPNLICPLPRCPNPDDPYTSELVPVGSDVSFPGHYRRFLFKMFAFVDNISVEPMHQQVTDGPLTHNCPQRMFCITILTRLSLLQMYLHCSTSLCLSMPGSFCEPNCFRKLKSECSVS